MRSIKQTLRYILLFIGSSSVLLLLVTGVAKIEAYYHSGADQRIAHQGFASVNENIPTLNWISNNNDGENIYLRKDLSRDYAHGWMWLNSCVNSKDWRGINDYFTQEFATELNKSFERSVLDHNQTILEHNIELIHLSEDYTIAVLRDSLLFHRNTYLDEHRSIDIPMFMTMEVHLILQDGRWKIFNWVELKHNRMKNKSDETSADTLQNNLQRIKEIKGINYYPKDSPWLEFWPEYDRLIVEQDLRKIAELNLNTVRIFLTLDALGREEINRKTIDKLDHFLKTAQQYDLKVIPTLFDFPIGYTIEKFPIYYRQLKFLVSRYKEHSAILAWNLKNELDLDFEIHGKQNVLGWANLMINLYKNIDDNHPITIGWAFPENLMLLENKIDYISVHHYTDITLLESELQKYPKLEKTVVIEEFGRPSNSYFFNMYRDTEQKQAEYLKEKISFYENNDLPWLLWTLYDFDHAPREVFGLNPLLRMSQKGFGILHLDNTPKQAFYQIEKILSK